MRTKHFEVKVTTTEAFMIHANNKEEAIDLAQEAMSNEQGALIDIAYKATEVGKVYNEKGDILEFENGIGIGFAHKDIKKEKEDDES